jgi:hypothetical protein
MRLKWELILSNQIWWWQRWFSSSTPWAYVVRNDQCFEITECSRKNNQNLDGKSITDWFVSDFTLPEIKLQAKQAFAESPQQYNNQYAIVTLKKWLLWQNENQKN